MKNIKDFYSDKYCNEFYVPVAKGIYKVEDTCYTSLCFEQEQEFGENGNAGDIARRPLEDILKKYGVFVQDFYDDYNLLTSSVCHLEFAGELENIKALRELIGKHVYCKGDELVIEEQDQK